MTQSDPGARDHAPPGTDRLLAGLTPEQAQAVTHGTGPLLLLAGPGAGKTRTPTHRAAYLLASGRAQPWEILAVTFSARAASELQLRLADLLGETVACGVTAATFHSVCARLLREHASVFGRTERYTIYDQGDMRRVIDWLLSDAERGQIQRALADYGQPASAEVLAEISRAKNRLLSPDGYERSAAHPGAPLIAAVWRESERQLRRCNAWDFDDLLAPAVRLLAESPSRLQWVRERWRWIIVDEFQDTSHSQAAFVDLVSGPAGNVCVCGDDDQCLAAGTEITSADGCRKPIEQVGAGDYVLSAQGGGVLGPSRVTNVRQFCRRDGVAITTSGGRRLVSTPEHIHFAGYRYDSTLPQLHLTYLMRREDRFRLGTTSVYTGAAVKPILGLHNRSVQEHADAAWVRSTHASEQEARLEELQLSLRYGIPQLPFVARPRKRRTGRSLVEEQALIDRLFGSMDTRTAGERLMTDHGLSMTHPHHIAQSVEGRRRTVFVTLCARRRSHRIEVRGRDGNLADRLRRAGYQPRPVVGKASGHWTLRVEARNMGVVLGHAERICALTDGQIRLMGRVGPAGHAAQRPSLPFMPASAVRPGMIMATERGEYEVVASVEAVQLDDPVYDLDIEHTHNLIANGLISHNSVYSWRSADVRNISNFAERHPGHAQIVLGRNFRSRAEILEAAVRCVSHNERHAAKALIAMRGSGGQVRVRAFANEYAEANWVAAQIADALAGGTPPAEILALARTGYATEPLQRALAHAGIPHRVLGSLGLYERTEVRDALAYLTLIQNPVDAQAFQRAIGSPRRGIGAATVAKLVGWAREQYGGDLIVASVRASELDGVRSQATRVRLVEFGTALEQIRGELAAGRSIGHVVIATVTISGGLVRHYQHQRDHTRDSDRRRDAERVLEDLRSLCRAAQSHDDQDEHATLTGFLEQAAGLHSQELDRTTDRRITLSTIHRAKGARRRKPSRCWAARRNCSPRGAPSPRPDPERLAEERRLFYVATTRAKDRLLTTHVAERGRRPTGGPSRFLEEAGLCQTDCSLAA